MGKNTNDWLILGIFILVVGLVLAVYSISTYVEIKNLGEKIDFELVDDNHNMSSTDKYYKYLTFAEFLNQKLDKNKNLIIKSSSCTYVDFAQHNAIELYMLTSKSLEGDEDKQNVAAGNIRALNSKLDNYGTCAKTKQYKAELDTLLKEIEDAQNIKFYKEQQMNKFLSAPRTEETLKESQEPRLIGEEAGETEEIPQD
jgi:hypothetical protein